MITLIDQLRKDAPGYRLQGYHETARMMGHMADVLEKSEKKDSASCPEQALRPTAATEGASGEVATPKQHFVLDHQINVLNGGIQIEGRNPGAGGAFTQYVLLLKPREEQPAVRALILDFQSKPIQTPDDFNGFTNEALLAIVIDRLRSFQQGPYSCRENSTALTKAEEALHWLQARSRERGIRGVEGRLQR